ncbi:SsrA-binding protein [Candidatus Tremblaya princeps]|uniref:SsrA-binding protein n=1 Tax=Tremblaya princeps TaxID=189385 RepID=A0A143WRA6_TREPR|nr:SsrA-binding protein [Candidatus Tremblaya princeps]
MSRGVLCYNKQCSERIAVACKYEAGMALRGWEVSSIRVSSASLLCASVRLAVGLPVRVGVGITPPPNLRPLCAAHTSATTQGRGYTHGFVPKAHSASALPVALYDNGGTSSALSLLAGG